MDFKTLTGFGLVLGVIGTFILSIPSLKSKFRNDKGEGASLGILEKPFQYSDDKWNRRCTWSGLLLVGLGFLSQLVALINLP